MHFPAISMHDQGFDACAVQYSWAPASGVRVGTMMSGLFVINRGLKDRAAFGAIARIYIGTIYVWATT